MELDESPVLRIAFFAGTDGNGRGVGDVSQDASVLQAPKLGDLSVKLVQGFDQLLRLLYQPFIFLPCLRPLGVLTLDGLPQTLERPCLVVDHVRLAPNLAHDGLEYVLVGFAAEENDLATRLPVILAGVEVVTMCDRRENNMAGRKDEDPVTFAAFTYI